MMRRMLGIAILVCLAGCPAPDGNGVGPIPTDLYVTATVRDVSSNPAAPDFVVDDRTDGGLSNGDLLALSQEIIQATRTAYFVSAVLSDPAEPLKFDAIVGPTPPLSAGSPASARFESGSIVLVVDSGWAYVSGDWPVTDTGVVRTGTLGSRAPSEWIVHVPPGGKPYVIYNVGRGGALALWIAGELLETQLDPGQKFEFDPAKGTAEYSAYDPGDEFLRDVVRIAAAAGVAIAP